MYVAYCPELDVSSCGHKIDEARKNLKEAVGILLDYRAKFCAAG